MSKANDFNSHAHVERDLYARLSVQVDFHFNSHAHVERDDTPYSALSAGNNFNSHAHVERDYYNHECKEDSQHFNSHAHVERDLNVMTEISVPSISTHTLTWSVTTVPAHWRMPSPFQLTRSRGA